ncbi:MAG TPA: WecB/TagA/CpsF family glycosyltransferase [Candidatus Magasanikbacteria bacterium]|nr:WecB/TagA/CpsF family glycosyltransferase [Candidatus Magasanikbacteria bacterium]
MKFSQIEITNKLPTEVLSQVRDFLNGNKVRTIFTPNPEMIVLARKDGEFAHVLNSSDLNVADGSGITILTRGHLPRYPGVELMRDILEIANEKSSKIFLLGTGNQKTLGTAVAKIKEKYPRIIISGTNIGPHFDQSGKITDESVDEESINQIIMTAPEIVFVAFGHGKQEKWIMKHKKDFPSVRIMMGVGGSIDMIAGVQRRAPCFLRKIGLEWLWRLICEPKRIGRIYRATVVFTLQNFKYFFKHYD